ncbi:MAG: 3-deoxy-7-phosphoheptulonate synthase [Candidatus Fischerbacteria bacterium RBG_13_37_8]|uniref:3-deoxy-7-phosphoheptulonate synthase n=1 Tax=Candidatus Fischerbacteria bacterium RBG_13_37_8 TaxID=1817863 RepID=A0A1F5VDN2_9BACT|nr:MAG: 3-deoxy-7-phosphoheptulonate synthase [Candidatus Fischerbacteria bacterium RBG_13_37_8]
MVVVIKKEASLKEISDVMKFIESSNIKFHVSKGEHRTIFGLLGEASAEFKEQLSSFPAVEKIVPIIKPYKLASLEFKPEPTVIKINGNFIGDGSFTVIAGPCAVESREQIIETAYFVKECGAHMLRGGAFKPRSSPYSFQGLGEEGLKYLAESKEKTGLPIVTEVLSPEDAELAAKYVDVLQIGARNMQNFALLKTVGTLGKPVFLKRGMVATIEEFLLAAEYILKSGTEHVILCERGIRTFDSALRNTLDISAVPMVKQLSHLPIIVDPSHATGKRELIAPMVKASLAAGADGVMVEIHKEPEKAKSDGPQSLHFPTFKQMMNEVNELSAILRNNHK